jgi:hypothetical protein
MTGDTRGVGRLPMDERTVPVTRESSFMGTAGRPGASNQSVGWSWRDDSDLPNRLQSLYLGKGDGLLPMRRSSSWYAAPNSPSMTCTQAGECPARDDRDSR